MCKFSDVTLYTISFLTEQPPAYVNMSDENWKTEFDNMCYALNMDCDAKKDALAK